MRTRLINERLVNLALITLSILVAPIAKAECGAAAHNGSSLSPELRSLPEPAPQRGKTSQTSMVHPRHKMMKGSIRGLLFSVSGRRSISLEGRWLI